MLRSYLLASVVAVTLLLPSLVVAAESCLSGSCHMAVVAAKRPHSPVKEGECDSCHRKDSKDHPTPGRKGFSLVATGSKLCASCHESPGKGEVSKHYPYAEGECTACHKPHGAEGKFLLENSDDLGELCFNCHDKEPFGRAVIHGPVATGSCVICHDPHRSTERHLLKKSGQEGCLACHTDMAKTITSATYVHPPIKVSGCVSCHDPHSSANKFLTRKKLPDLCLDCHKSLEDKLSKITTPHKPLTEPGSCGICHATHASSFSRLLIANEKDICLGCHGVATLGTPPLRNIKSELQGKKFLHGPLNLGKCTACHDPHGNGQFRSLVGAYPQTLYAPYKEGAYDLCLKCHNKNLLAFPETTIYTSFRNGKRNLHYLHVVDTRKGRTCRVCHEPHASNSEKLISGAGSSFGAWSIPLNFKITPTGGSCAPGCHRPFKYDRENPELNEKPQAKTSEKPQDKKNNNTQDKKDEKPQEKSDAKPIETPVISPRGQQ